MASELSQRLWEQAADDNNYETADEIRREEEEQRKRERAYYTVYVDPRSPFADEAVRENALRRDRLFRAFGAASDPEHLLYPGLTLPSAMDCIQKHQLPHIEF